MTGCGSDEPTAEEKAASERRVAEALGPTTPGKYEQTWPRSYSNTTCQDWTATMTELQRFAAAADMLTGARNKGDGGTGLPPDSLIATFEQGVTTACVVPTATVAETGAGLYLTERERFRP